MTYPVALLIILGSLVGPATLSLLVSSCSGAESRRCYHEIGIAVFLQLGVIFAVLLAFVFSNVWDHFQTASATIEREVIDLRSAVERAAFLKPEDANAVRSALAHYLQHEIHDEWPSLSGAGLGNPGTTAAYEQLIGTLVEIPAADPRSAAARTGLLRLTADVENQRQLRLLHVEATIPGILWGLLISFSAALTGFVMLSEVGHNAVQAVLVGVFSGFLAGALVMIYMLDHPFSGDAGIRPTSLVVILDDLHDNT